MAAAASTSAAKVASKLAIVTGANKGIGLEIVRGLAKTGQFRVVLCSRDKVRGLEAAGTLEREGLSVEVQQVDLNDEVSIHNIEKLIDETNEGVLDVLVNNAGMAYKGSIFGHIEAGQTIKTNYLGTMGVTDRMLEYLRRSPDGRIVNVCSQAGRLSQLSVPLQARFRDPALTREKLTALTQEFVAAILADEYKDRGWSSSMYGVSKAAMIAYSNIVAREERESGVICNAFCPGYCATDMSSHRGPRSAAQGAACAIYLATTPRDRLALDGGPITGRFFYERDPLAPFEEEWKPQPGDETSIKEAESGKPGK